MEENYRAGMFRRPQIIGRMMCGFFTIVRLLNVDEERNDMPLYGK